MSTKTRYEGDLEELAETLERAARNAANDHVGDVPETSPEWFGVYDAEINAALEALHPADVSEVNRLIQVVAERRRQLGIKAHQLPTRKLEPRHGLGGDFTIQIARSRQGPWESLIAPAPRCRARDLYAQARVLMVSPEGEGLYIRVARDHQGSRAVYLLTPKHRAATIRVRKQFPGLARSGTARDES